LSRPIKRLFSTFSRFAGSGALLVAFVCGCGDEPDPTAPSDVVAEVSATISTVVNVHWTTEKASIGYVEYGPTAAMEFNTPLESAPTKQHALTLLGLTADTEYFYRVVTWDGADAGASEVRTIRTGDLPVGMPRLTLTGEGHDQFTIVPILGTTRAVTIINSDGKIVWYHSDDRDLDFYRARLSVDGKSILYNAASVSGDPADNSELVRVALDGSGSTSIPVPLLAHDFVEHPDGTLAAMVVEYRDFEGTMIRGDKIVEIAPTGEQTTVWTGWDCFDPAVDPSDDLAHGWTFANALDYDPDQNVYYLGMRNFSSIAKINRDSGACEWVLGFSGSTFDFAAGSARFLHQHQFQVRGDHILVMDNDGGPGNVSRVLEFQLDFAASIATEVWSYTSDPSVYTFVLGEPTRFDDGSTFINWSSAGQMERVNADGASIWKLNSGAGFAFGFNTIAKSLYPANASMP
jgi:Arylsulfotransferase (ASST)/Purple acid Phosphatase, N-terminal domain